MAPVAFVPNPAEGLNHPNVLQMLMARVQRTPDLPALRYKHHGVWRSLTSVSYTHLTLPTSDLV